MKRLVHTCLLAAGWAVGCSSSDPATEADYDDVAQSLSAVVATSSNAGGDIGAMFDSTTVALGASEGLTFGVNAQGAYSGARLGFNYTYKGTCHDAAGALMSKCGAASDDAQVDVAWDGELSIPRVEAAVKRTGSWKLANIQAGPIELSGMGDFTLDLAVQPLFREGNRSYHVSYEAQYAGIKLNRPLRRIESGTVHYVIDAERTVSTARRESEAEFHMDGELTFSGDGKATLSLDGKFNYQLDTATGAVVKTTN